MAQPSDEARFEHSLDAIALIERDGAVFYVSPPLSHKPPLLGCTMAAGTRHWPNGWSAGQCCRLTL
ncbi:MAG: hypothetical protein IRY99_07325 [Isosphaeraceae bacterium]|nr:hypothetical protein [Isosphaeraceae bacterium]